MKTQEQLEKDIDLKILLASARFFERNGVWYFEPYLKDPEGPFASKLAALVAYENLRVYQQMIN